VCIVDDRWLTIGSANLNAHSLLNDTEMNVATDDPELAYWTRVRLWAEHLELDEATVAEFHPEGTDYWAPQAPIAPRYFPFNRCDAWECSVCSRVYLRYTEGGGYFVDQRIRALTHAALVDAPLP